MLVGEDGAVWIDLGEGWTAPPDEATADAWRSTCPDEAQFWQRLTIGEGRAFELTGGLYAEEQADGRTTRRYDLTDVYGVAVGAPGGDSFDRAEIWYDIETLAPVRLSLDLRSDAGELADPLGLFGLDGGIKETSIDVRLSRLNDPTIEVDFPDGLQVPPEPAG